MNITFSLTGTQALITGGGSGIGLGIARCFAACGAKVILVGRQEARLKSASDSVGENAFAEAFDVTDLAAIPDFAQAVEAKYGPVQVLINNAGIHLKKPVVDITDEEFRQVQMTHVNSAFALGREFGKLMIGRRDGHILFIASMAALFGIPKVVAYSAAKSAHLGLVHSMAVDFGPYGVRVNAIAPGWIHSEMMGKALQDDPQRKEKILSRTPLGNFGDPADIGWAAAYLSSPAAKFITGVCLPVDGGASIGF